MVAPGPSPEDASGRPGISGKGDGLPVEIIRKPKAALEHANLRDYRSACAGFSWDAARRELDGLPGRGLNIAHETVDRHAHGPAASKIALRCLSRTRPAFELSYAELSALTARFANVLRGLGIAKGERVFALA